MTLFQIQNISVEQSSGERIITGVCTIEATVELMCDKHKKKFATLRLKSQGKSMFEDECIKKAVEALLNHNYYPHIDLHLTNCRCAPQWGFMQYNFDNLEEPWKGMFTDLFSDQVWTPPMAQLTPGTKALPNAV